MPLNSSSSPSPVPSPGRPASQGAPGRDAKTVERFWSKVDTTGECWEWTRGRHRNGYGCFHADGRSYRAHRFAWELTNGVIPNGLYVLHQCDNPSCVRPDHLYLGTQGDNMADCAAKGRLVTVRGASKHRAVLNDDAVREIRRLYATGAFSQRELSKQFGVCNKVVCQVIHRQRWSHVK